MRQLTTLMLAGVFAATHATTPAPVLASSKAQSVTLEGCLRSGSASGEYIVSTGVERHTAMAEPGVRLGEHLNHRVHLTGALEETPIGAVFLVSDVRTIATTCAMTR